MLVRIGSPRVLARRTALGTLAASVAVVGIPAFAQAAPPTTPFISELHYDNAGADVDEFVEVQFPAGSSTTGWTVELYNGSNGARYDSDSLEPNADGIAVVTYSGTLQNGSPDGIALVGPAGLVEFLSYEGVMTASNSTAAGTTSIDIGVSEAGTEPAGQSLSRSYDAGTDALVWSGPAAATPGVVNSAAPGPVEPPPAAGEVCDTAVTNEIGEVQGAGGTTPLAGSTVTVRGVVVGDTPGLSGFYLQDVDGDGDAATSDGIFVFSSVEVDLGDTVAVTGLAQEYFDQTQIRGEANVGICADGTAADLPSATPLDLPADDDVRERLEGMLVAPVDPLTVSEVFDLTSFGELTLSERGRLVQPTELARPGAEADAIAAENALRSIVLDDALSSRVSVTTAPYLSPETPVRVGDTLTFTEPLVLGYGFDAWRLQPADGTADGVFGLQNTRPAAPGVVGGDVQVGAFNVLNYFLTQGGVGRGATSDAEFAEQAGKIVPAINALGADVVTLMEIEDTDSTGLTPGDADTALADLVARLNADAGAGTWAFVPFPEELYAVDRDVIRNAIIYRPAAVTPVGPSVGLVDETVWSNAREPIAQTFTADGDAFTVVANHFKSKGGTGTGDNLDTGQGSFNGDRVRQAGSLAAFAEQLEARTGDPDVLLMGDFNAYTQEDPIEVLREEGFVDLGELFDPGRYSYVFDALSGSLDHALATQELTAKVTDVVHWNINSVESFAYQYSGDPALYAADPYRSSDHDPLLLGIDLQEAVVEPEPLLCQGLEPTIVGTEGDDVLVGGNGVDVIMGLGGDDVITGGNGADVICGGNGDDVVNGNNGDDVLLGGAGDDRLYGDNGSDTLIGGPGTDVLDQGRGTGREDQDGAES
ncbi:ExeM/NucH family extracellular endonuclease [Blastococcus sp. VKM Ac-2987]|uniref:ExeM/NucH family extracellular endonuclease n=1 Tax=Blastococcus sp. VKM Ac-2987 TaxID=3004141 RepID=UPI0022AB8F70|nr:ExeM/NucH family extracellular endonuclease [Blastococcus sp. VKM Ac-2987]MCZ2861208.1 ExeM/NucH family extracellular endonuclease [Blastococcus sp. VKM Ac-2987]